MTEPSPSLADRLASGPPLIAVPLTDAVTDAELGELAAAGLDVAELRVDLFSSTDPSFVVDHVERLAAAAGPATLATIRSAAEGGSWGGSDDERFALYERVIPLVDAVDVELSSTAILGPVVDAAHDAGLVAVVSTHDFERTPDLDDLRAIAADARAASADLAKVATTAETDDDLRTLAAFVLAETQDGGGPVAVVAMGRFGPASRITLPLLGSRLTFASYRSAVASGQLTFDQTRALLTQLAR